MKKNNNVPIALEFYLVIIVCLLFHGTLCVNILSYLTFQCSVTCGSGWKNRKVSCMFENREVSFKKCQDSDRPQDHSSCFEDVMCNADSDNGLIVSLLPPPTSIQITSVWVVTNWSMVSLSNTNETIGFALKKCFKNIFFSLSYIYSYFQSRLKLNTTI